jgi:uncharacterized membrane protein (DUF485 family)
MLSQAGKEILKNKDFHKLVLVRRWVAWSFLLVLLGSYLAFGLLSVYSPSFLALPILSGGVVPIGIAMGYMILALSFILALVYVWLTNSNFEPLGQNSPHAAPLPADIRDWRPHWSWCCSVRPFGFRCWVLINRFSRTPIQLCLR